MPSRRAARLRAARAALCAPPTTTIRVAIRDSSCYERPLPLSHPPLQVRVRARRPASAAAATTTTTAEVSVGVGVRVRILLARARGRQRPELTGFCVSKLLRVCWSVRGCVCACLSTRPLCRVPPLFSRFLRSFDLDLARPVEVNRVFSAVFGRGVTRKPPPLGVRCLFSVFVGMACFSSLN